MLLVYTRRHNGDVGDQERKGLSPLGTAPFSCKYFQKLFIVLNTTWPPCHMAANQE